MNKVLQSTERLIEEWKLGDISARDELMRRLHGEISSIASAILRKENRHVSIVTGDLVNEAVIRLLKSETLNLTGKTHLLALFAKVMRQALLDMAKARESQKRKGFHVTLTDAEDELQSLDADFLNIERVLKQLEEIDPERAAVVELRYFGGMSIEDIASYLDTSPATVKRRWHAARLWLRKKLDDSS
ncbi:MAG: ECF-type sigma factor [Pseudomonadales bacterium]